MEFFGIDQAFGRDAAGGFLQRERRFHRSRGRPLAAFWAANGFPRAKSRRLCFALWPINCYVPFFLKGLLQSIGPPDFQKAPNRPHTREIQQMIKKRTLGGVAP